MNLGQGMNGSEWCKWWKVAMPLIQCPCLPSLTKSVHPVALPTASTHFAPTQGRSAPEKMPLGASLNPWLTGYCVGNYTTVSLPFTWDNSELHVLDCFPVPWVGVNTFTDLFSSLSYIPFSYLSYVPISYQYFLKLFPISTTDTQILIPVPLRGKSERRHLSRFTTKLMKHQHQSPLLTWGPGKGPRNVFTHPVFVKFIQKA